MRQNDGVADWRWFCAWVAVGAGAALCAVSLGLLFGVPVVAATVWLAQRPAARRSAFGVLTGVGVLFLYVAYLQRHGPGTHCWHSATGSGCVHGLDPVPWLALGLAFLAGGMVGQAWLRRT